MHTKGWRWAFRNRGWFVHDSDDGSLVASVFSEANAILIAEAPAMLDALENIRNAMQRNIPDIDILDCIVDIADEAISKVKGEQSCQSKD